MKSFEFTYPSIETFYFMILIPYIYGKGQAQNKTTYIWFIDITRTHIIPNMKKDIKKQRKELGERIRNIRRSAGFTQEKLGEKADLSYKYISELERGQVNVSIDSLIRIADAVGVKIGDLFSKEKTEIQKVFIKEKNPLSKLSPQDRQQIKHALKLLNKVFSKA